MQLIITGRRQDVSDALREHIKKVASKLEHFDDQIVDCHVVLDIEKHRKIADISLNVHHHALQSRHAADSVYVAIDEAFEKLEKQLKRLGGRLKEHYANRGKGASSLEEASEEE